MSDIVDRLRRDGQDEGADEIVKLRRAVLEMYSAVMFNRRRKQAIEVARMHGPKDFASAALLNGFHEIDMKFRNLEP